MDKALAWILGICGMVAVVAGIGLIRSVPLEDIPAGSEAIIRKMPRGRILFVGDMMFDRSIRERAATSSYPALFSCVDRYLRSFDLVVGNLEGPITDSPSLSVGSVPGKSGNTTFTFDPAVANVLADEHIRAVNLGNNHIRDFGREGQASTEEALRAAGVGYLGAPGGNIGELVQIHGWNVALVNYNQFLGMADATATADEIRKFRPISDFIAVYTHWGDEYLPETEAEKTLAHEFIDAGADLVIGTHPHVIQAHETYKGKNIYYSLGNFIFDQYFNEAVKEGQGVEIAFDAAGVRTGDVVFDIGKNGTCKR